MTEFATENWYRHVREQSEAFEMAKGRNDWQAAEKAILQLLYIVDYVFTESRRTEKEKSSYENLVLKYERRRVDLPIAPDIDGYCYVQTAKFPWVCVAKQHRELIYLREFNYYQEHYAPDKTAVCGKKVAFPIRDRFSSPSWPRLHELCPDCVKLLLKMGIMPSDVGKAEFMSSKSNSEDKACDSGDFAANSIKQSYKVV